MWSSIFHSIFHGPLRERDLAILLVAGGIALVVGSISAWIGARSGAKRAIRRAFREHIEIPSVVTDARYDELSRSIDAIALEVERIAEAQRFAARLLVERQNPSLGTPAAPKREPGVTTPH